MRKYLALMVLMLATMVASAQYSTGTGTITDPSSTNWGGASVTATFYPAPNFTGNYTWNGQQQRTFNPVLATANSSGVFSIQVPDNSLISPARTMWSFTICPLASTVCQTTVPVSMVGGSVSLTTLIANTITSPTINPTGVQYAYNDAEVLPMPGLGQVYYRTSDLTFRQWNGTAWVPIGGGGTNGITALTGAVTATGPGSTVATITPTGVTAGSYGGPASVPVLSINQAGQISSASNTPITPTGIGAAKAPVYSITPVVDYQFQEGSGTVLHDFSGNNYNATLGTGGRAPTWIPNGLVFPNNTGVDMPAQSAINSAMTWCWVGNFTPLAQNSINTTGYLPLMASNDGGTNGVSYSAQYSGVLAGGAYGNGAGLSSFGTFITGAGVTSINAAYAGVQRICVVRGLTSNSTVDHVYLNGVEVDSYQKQGKSGDTTNATFYTIGAEASGTWTGGLFGSTLYRETGWAAQLTSAQIQQADQVQQYDLITRGISYNPVYLTHSLPQLVNMGDSITFCQGVTSGLCWNLSANLQPKLTNQPTYIENNFGITSVTAFAIGNAEPGRGTNFCQTSQGPGVLTLWEGTNDIADFVGMSTQTLVGNIAGAVQKYKLAGCRVYIMTTISRCGNVGQTGCLASGTFEAARATFNQTLLQKIKVMGADGVIDIAALPYLGSTNAYNAGAGGGTCPGATTYFQADCVHPTNTAQPFISTVVANSLNYYSGTTLSHPYIVTATATLPSSARVTDASGCTSACTLTLPDGTGPSGETYTIITGPTNVVSVQGQTLYGLAQTVNGSSSPVALPISSTVNLKIVPLSQTTAGIEWVSSAPDGIVNVTTTVGTTPIGANTCTSTTTVSMPGVTTLSVFNFIPNADVSGVTGWGSVGGLTINSWPTAGALNYKICNQTASSITPGASVTFNVGAK